VRVGDLKLSCTHRTTRKRWTIPYSNRKRPRGTKFPSGRGLWAAQCANEPNTKQESCSTGMNAQGYIFIVLLLLLLSLLEKTFEPEHTLPLIRTLLLDTTLAGPYDWYSRVSEATSSSRNLIHPITIAPNVFIVTDRT